MNTPKHQTLQNPNTAIPLQRRTPNHLTFGRFERKSYMFDIFRKRRNRPSSTRELARQWTSYQRRNLENAQVPPGGIPYSAYDRMETDSMIQTALTVKRLGVLAAPYRIVPAGETPEAIRNADFVEDQFNRMQGSPETILMGAMDAFAKGWSAQELIWGASGRRLNLIEVKPKDPSLFGFEMDAFGRIRGLKLQIPGEAEIELPRGKFALYFNRPTYARAKGRSDLEAAYGHWSAKENLLAMWRVHLERFAMPTILGKFASGTPDDETGAMLRTLESLNDVTAITYSDAFEVHTVGGDKESSTGFMEAIEFHNREIARAILGQTLATDEGRRVGSLALGKVHLQVLLLQLEGVRKHLADSLMNEQIIRPMVELNFGSSPLPRFVFEPVSLGAFASGRVV